MSPMPLWKHAFAYVTLGLLCGWYYFLLILYPVLLFLAFRGSYIAAVIFVTFIILSVTPIKHKAWDAFMYCWMWTVWREYFDMTMDIETIKGNLKKDSRYVFFEFPHGIFPMGQFLSASLIREITPGKMVCGTSADIVFYFPVMRQLFAWIGTHPAKRASFTKIFQAGHYCAVIPGGIAEMYVMNKETESIFLRKRHNTVKMAIQEGAHIIPAFFFGNTRIFDLPTSKGGSESFLAKLSRKLRASIVIFYGRHYLPVPFRTPLHMVSGDIVEVKQSDNPTEEEINEVLGRVIASVEKLYRDRKPEWETRPLVIQ